MALETDGTESAGKRPLYGKAAAEPPHSKQVPDFDQYCHDEGIQTNHYRGAH